MKNLKKMIILLVSILLILLIVLAINNKRNSKFETPLEEDTNKSDETLNNMNDLSDYGTYFEIKECIDFYTTTLADFLKKDEYIERYQFTEENFNELMKENVSIAYNLLDKNFLNEFRLSENNLISFYKDYKFNEFIIDEIYEYNATGNVSNYLVYGRMIENDETKNYGFIVNLDKLNLTFSLCPYEYMQKKGWDSYKQNISLENIDNIESNQYNTYEEILSADEEKIAKEYFSLYKKNLIYDKHFLYEKLKDDYKAKRYDTYEKFEEYINKRYSKLVTAQINSYQKTEEEGMIQYICTDTNGNYYVYQGTSLTNYDIMLDSYTIDLKSFLDKYNSTEDKGKVAMNIQRSIQAINLEDYEYVYDHLSNGFKNNYFKTEQDFETYVKENFFEKNYTSYVDFNESSGVYTYKVEISDSEESLGNKTTKTFIMKLKEGTEFEMSFDV